MNIDKDLEEREKITEEKIVSILSIVKGMPVSQAKEIIDRAVEVMIGTATVTLS